MGNTKERMVDATIELICLGKCPGEITVADITEKAGVGNGMVNYHFQSKDNLMKTAVKKVLGCTNKMLTENLVFDQNTTAIQKITAVLQRILDLIAQNPEISRIAILDNLENENGVTHIVSHTDLFHSCLTELCGNDQQQILIKQTAAEGFINTLFLKADINRKECGFDFYDKAQRDRAAEEFASAMFL
ncbi:MAG: TetR/AcrR family transcriptional regulator [Eubacteriales bacterium]